MSSDEELRATAKYLFELGTLKRLPRTGWLIAGVPNPESIADHSHRTSVLAAMLAVMEGADPARACLMAALHDTQETRVGDIPHIGRRYLTAASNEAVTADQVQGCPSDVAGVIQGVVDDYERQDSVEAVVARDADKLECVLTAVEYMQGGPAHLQDWIDSCRGALKTESAQRLAGTAVSMTGQEWRQN